MTLKRHTNFSRRTKSPDYDPEAFSVRDLTTNANLRSLELEILKKLRGKQSQEAMSRKLGTVFNVYGKWETGLKRVLWNDLVKVLGARKIEISQALEDIYKITGCTRRTEASVIVSHFKRSYFSDDVTKLATYLEITPSRATRWSQGKSQVPAQKILKLLLYRSQLFILLLERIQLVDVRPEFATELLRIKTLMADQDRTPYNIAVLYFLVTEDYLQSPTHDNSLIAQKLQLQLEQVERALRNLEQHGAIAYNGEKYDVKTRSFEYPASDYRQTIPMFNYWIYRSLCYLHDKVLTNRQTEIPNASSFRVFSVSKKTAAQISEKIRETHHEILRLIKDSDEEGDHVVRAVVLNHFGLEESPPFQIVADPETGFKIL